MHGVDVGIAVLRRDHLHENAALDLDGRRSGPHDHPGLGLDCARGHRVARALELDHAEPAAAEGLEARVVAQGRDLLAVPLRDFVQGLAAREGDPFPVQRQSGPVAVIHFLSTWLRTRSGK